MTEVPHSRAWYARLARELGGYRHPWARELDGPDPKLTYEALLADHLAPTTRVLEAGCGHGPDATRFGPLAARWTAYDREPELLRLAAEHAPGADLHLWDGRGALPAALRGPFDLIVSRRGPTGVILRLPGLAAPGARFLYVGPTLEVAAVPERLREVGWAVLGEWCASVRAWAPTWDDWRTRYAFMGEEARRGDWDSSATGRGLSYREERYTVLAASP